MSGHGLVLDHGDAQAVASKRSVVVAFNRSPHPFENDKVAIGCGHIAFITDVAQIDQLWNAIVPHRFIMTFRSEGFNAPRLEERLTDMTAQDIFVPDMIIIDGLSFETDHRSQLEALKALAQQLDLPVWFTITTHRHEELAEDGLPMQLSPVQDLFDAALTINPEQDAIHIRAIKGTLKDEAEPALILDPATMLIQRQT